MMGELRPSRSAILVLVHEHRDCRVANSAASDIRESRNEARSQEEEHSQSKGEVVLELLVPHPVQLDALRRHVTLDVLRLPLHRLDVLTPRR